MQPLNRPKPISAKSTSGSLVAQGERLNSHPPADKCDEQSMTRSPSKMCDASLLSLRFSPQKGVGPSESGPACAGRIMFFICSIRVR
jgi:hypothetical protein